MILDFLSLIFYGGISIIALFTFLAVCGIVEEKIMFARKGKEQVIENYNK